MIAWIGFVALSYLTPWWNRLYFLWDDIELLVRLHRFSIEAIFTPLQYQFFPTFQFLYWLEIQLFGINSSLFVGVTVLLHLTNIVLVYKIITRLTRNQLLAFIGSVLVSFNKSYFTIIFWPSFQSSVFSTTFSLVSVILWFQLMAKYDKKRLLFFVLSNIAAATSFGFANFNGFIFAIMTFFFWKQSQMRRTVAVFSILTGVAVTGLTLLAASEALHGDQIVNISPYKLFNMAYFIAVGPTQGVITKFFLPGFIPDRFNSGNIFVMILVPLVVIAFFLWIARLSVIKQGQKGRKAIGNIILLSGFFVSPYIVASLARTHEGALGALAERYVYFPFFFFSLAMVYVFSLVKNLWPRRRHLIQTLIAGGTIVLSVGHQIVMHLQVNLLFR